MLDTPKRGNEALTPFDTDRLDRLMEDAGIDVLLANSKHNVQYLLGGHRSFFFEYMDAMGLSRYLPLVIYPKGAPDKAAFIGHRMDAHQRELQPFWTPQTVTNCSGTLDTIRKAIEHIHKAGVKTKAIGIELAFLPADAMLALQSTFPDSAFKDTLFVLERLRALKRPVELELLRAASEHVIEFMKAVIGNHGAGVTKRELVEALRQEETARGLTFEYCLITTGTSFNRAPSDQPWEDGQILSLDSGGNYHGYIGDVCRMAILGEPDAELEDCLAEIEEVQRAAMKPIKPGVIGGRIYEEAEKVVGRSKNREHLVFLAHGMGLVSHEAPRLTAKGPVPYDAYDATRSLETGMVVSVETTLQHPRRGFIKLEDTVAVTANGFEIYGEGARGWNRGACSLQQ